jgi:hypothetical protein
MMAENVVLVSNMIQLLKNGSIDMAEQDPFDPSKKPSPLL